MAVDNDKEMCWLPAHPTLITSPGLEAQAQHKPQRGCVPLKSEHWVWLLWQKNCCNQKLLDNGGKIQGVTLQRRFSSDVLFHKHKEQDSSTGHSKRWMLKQKNLFCRKKHLTQSKEWMHQELERSCSNYPASRTALCICMLEKAAMWKSGLLFMNLSLG